MRIIRHHILTIENPFLIIFTARNENGKLTRPNLICTLKRFIRTYPMSIGNNLKSDTILSH